MELNGIEWQSAKSTRIERNCELNTIERSCVQLSGPKQNTAKESKQAEFVESNGIHQNLVALFFGRAQNIVSVFYYVGKSF